jgi:hypothetical protein
MKRALLRRVIGLALCVGVAVAACSMPSFGPPKLGHAGHTGLAAVAA